MFRKKDLNQLLGGCLTDYKTYARGTYRGFQVIFNLRTVNNVQMFYATINASAPNQEAFSALTSYLEEQKSSNKFFRGFTCYEHFIELELTSPTLAKKIPAAFNDIIDPIIQYIIMQGFTAGCQNCGDQTAPLDCYQINNTHQMLCSSCSHEVEALLEDNRAAIKGQKSSLVPGLVGALLGALIGGAMWIGIYKLGYIAGIAGAVTVICAMKGYEKFGGAMDVKGVLISVLISVAMIYFANNIAWAWEAYDALKSYGFTFSDAYRGLHDILVETETTNSYYADLGIGYFLTLICSIGTIVNALRTSSGSYRMRKAK